jgi:TonB family protein
VPSAAAAKAVDAAAAVYTIADENVKPPVTIDQRMPAMPLQLLSIVRATHARGMLDVLIDETGHVVDVTLRQPLNPAFDPLVMRTARDWKYNPATKDGVPVRFVKTILLVP